MQVERRRPSVKDVNEEAESEAPVPQAEGIPRRVVSGGMLFLSLLPNIHEMRSGEQKANPGVAGIAVAVQENCFPQCFESPSCVEDYK